MDIQPRINPSLSLKTLAAIAIAPALAGMFGVLIIGMMAA